MTAEEKNNVGVIVKWAVAGILVQAVVGIGVGFGVLNKDHFKIQSNNEKILEMDKELREKVSYDAFNQYIRYQKEQNDLLRQLIESNTADNKERIERLEKQIDNLQLRMDQMFNMYGIGVVRGDEFEVDVIPERFKTDK